MLLKSAFQLVGKIGSEALTLREVARRAGVSHNAPYRHFKSKEDLVAALATEAFRQLHQFLKERDGFRRSRRAPGGGGARLSAIWPGKPRSI